MVELELTLISHMGEPIPNIDNILYEFEVEHQIRVRLTMLSWTAGRTELVNYALFKNSPDVSEVGTTWLSSLIAMGALRPFTASEINQMGGSMAFLPAAWASCAAQSKTLSVPWMTDTRAIYYRRDLLAAAGIDEKTAFQTLDQMRQTLQKLQNCDFSPWVVPTRNTWEVLHSAASWVWQAGGEFMSADGRSPRFHEPAAKAGFYRYFQDQFPYMTPAVYHLTDAESLGLFRRNKAAATVSGQWAIDIIEKWSDPVVKENYGLATLPVPTFVGGANLVVWKYSHHPQEAIKLVNYLTSPAVQSRLLPQLNLLPARHEAFQQPPFSTSPHYQTVYRSLQNGRSLQTAYLWGMVEDRLSTTLNHLWQELFKNPGLDLPEAIDQELDRVARRLERTLSAEN